MSTLSLHDIETIETIESDESATEQEEALALQRAINSLTAWSLQGSYGRAMMQAISSGRCMFATSDARDYYGNRIPSRFEVQEGAKGSRAYVVEHMGEDWAAMLEAA